MKLLSEAKTNYKIAKNEGHGYLSYILHLAPAKLSGYNTCQKASEGCAKACLNSAGRGAFNNVQQARINKTLRFFKDHKAFMADLVQDIARAERKAAKLGQKAVIRLNGTSDLNWMLIKTDNGLNLFERFPNVQFYDYTAVIKHLEMNNFPNYHLTFSRKENNDQDVMRALDLGYNVSIVFKAKELPTQAFGIPVQSGENNDLRFLDKKIEGGSWIGLIAKGKAKKDLSGFAVSIN